MRMTTHRGLGAVAAGAMLLLAGGIAGAQEADLRGQVEDLLQRYEEAPSPPATSGRWRPSTRRTRSIRP